jgi:hypothetical protein
MNRSLSQHFSLFRISGVDPSTKRWTRRRTAASTCARTRAPAGTRLVRAESAAALENILLEQRRSRPARTNARLSGAPRGDVLVGLRGLSRLGGCPRWRWRACAAAAFAIVVIITSPYPATARRRRVGVFADLDATRFRILNDGMVDPIVGQSFPYGCIVLRAHRRRSDAEEQQADTECAQCPLSHGPECRAATALESREIEVAPWLCQKLGSRVSNPVAMAERACTAAMRGACIGDASCKLRQFRPFM